MWHQAAATISILRMDGAAQKNDIVIRCNFEPFPDCGQCNLDQCNWHAANGAAANTCRAIATTSAGAGSKRATLPAS